jgi:microcystin degradation protein MlrC
MIKSALILLITCSIYLGLHISSFLKHEFYFSPIYPAKNESRYIQTKVLPRIAIAGLGIESSTFSPALTHEEAFRAKYGETVFTSYPFLSADSPLRKRATYIPTIVGKSLPGGAVTREAYESLVGKTLDSLKKYAPYDGLFFDIHGAMSVVGLDDPEGDFIQRVRKVIGKQTVISTSMDLHGIVSWRLA